MLCLVFLGFFLAIVVSSDQTYNEILNVKNYNAGDSQLEFQFNYNINDSISKMLSNYPTLKSITLSFSQQRWNFESWGRKPDHLENPAGVYAKIELYSLLDGVILKPLIRYLGGMFCASLELNDFFIYQSKSEGVILEALLPREAVCTENLAPWLRLLPCGWKGGLASLLTPITIYQNSRYNQIYLNWRREVEGVGDSSFAQKMSFLLVLEANLAEDLLAKEKQVRKCIGKSKVELIKEANIKSMPIKIRRHCQSLSAEHGIINLEFEPKSEITTNITVRQIFPKQMRIFLHKLPRDIKVKKISSAFDELYLKGSLIELEILIKGKRTVSLHYRVLLLKYSEYPIDSHRGLDLVPALVKYSLDGEEELMMLWTMTSLVRMPLPDFSMPFNVITITCTLIALFHGQLYNRLTRRFIQIPENTHATRKQIVLKNIWEWAKKRW